MGGGGQPGRIAGGGDGLAPDKEKPEREGLVCKNLREGGRKLSRESPISNPFPEELTKKDFKRSAPPPPPHPPGRGEGRKLALEQAMTLIITVPNPRAGLQSSFAADPSQPW